MVVALLSMSACGDDSSISERQSQLTAGLATWGNDPFSLTNFTVSFDATPTQNQEDVVIGLSQGAAATYADLAAVVRFNPSGKLDARNGGAYAAQAAVSYVAGASYHVDLDVNMPAHSYNVRVTPPGQPSVVLAQNYAFRTEQASVAVLANLAKFGAVGDANVTHVVLTIGLPDLGAAPSDAGAPKPDATPPPPTSPPPTSPPPSNGSCPANDGSASAPTGTAQYPNLLSKYPKTIKTDLGCNIAGVHYPVGYPSTRVLKNPAVDAPPAGVTFDQSSKTATITADNVVIDGWDFSGGGGWTVYADHANNPTIQNCNFKVGSLAQVPIRLLGRANYSNGGDSATIRNNVLDGNGVNVGGLAMLFISRGRNVVVQYNWIKNSGCDHIMAGAETVASGIATTWDIRYNIFENNGTTSSDANPVHADWIQTTANNHYNSIIFDFNTVIQDKAWLSGGGSQGFTFDGNANAPLATFDNGDVSYNTVVTSCQPAGSLGYIFRVAPDLITGTYTFNGNYVDPGGLSDPATMFTRVSIAGGPYHGTVPRAGNVDLRSGTQPTGWNGKL
jgi:hypothetical protein